MSKFQIILTSVFVIFIISGVALFATYKGSSESQTLPTIEVWGTFPKSVIETFIQKINNEREVPIYINYTEISENDFDNSFIQELARGGGPDAILISQNRIAKHYDKVIQIPKTVLTRRDFQNTYIPQADLYLTSQGTLALPFVVDPLVMYVNKDAFTNAGIALYPKFWDEFIDINKLLTVKDENSNIKKSTIALGEFDNITNAREIVSALVLQAGNPITFYSEYGLQSAIGNNQFINSQSAVPAISFYTQFSDPRNPQYSWNRSLPSSKNSFLSGNLAVYFGFTSEIYDIKGKNPNLNFDVAPFPQARGGQNRTTYSDLYGFSIVRSTQNQNATYQVLSILTSPSALSTLAEVVYLPSVRRDVIATGSTDPYMSIFLDSALISKGWLDVDVERSNQIFRKLIETVTSGRADVSSALRQANDELDISLGNI